MNQTVCFSYRAEALGDGGNLSGRLPLFNMLREHELQPVVSLGAEAAYQGEALRVHELQAEQTVGVAGTVALAGVGLIVNRLNRSINKATLTRPDLLPPLINENETRSLAFRKQRMHDEVLAPLGFHIPTSLPATTEAARDFADQHPAAQYVVKPNCGTNGKGVERLAAAQLAQAYDDHPEWRSSMVLQPACDFSGAFPAGLQPYDQSSAEALAGWNRPGVAKELRVYGFHSPEQTAVFPVGRALHEGSDQWFFVDPQSVPTELLGWTAQVMQQAAHVSGAAAMLGTVDYGYGSYDDRPPQWRAIEVNGKAPYVIGYDKHVGVATELRQRLAGQIAETVQATGAEPTH